MRIRPYDQQISAQGEIGGTRATPDDFGAQVGRAEGTMAETTQQVSEVEQHLVAARNQVWNNQTASSYQLDRMQALQSAKTDPDFATKYGADGQGFAAAFKENSFAAKNKLIDAAPSPMAAQSLQMELDNIDTTLSAHAQTYQAQAGGEYMKNQVSTMLQTDAKIVATDPTQASAVMDRGKLAIAKLPLLDDNARTELLKSYENNIAMAAGKNMALHHSEALLGALAPDVLAGFKPTARVVAAQGGNATGFGPAKVSAEVSAYTPLITTAAAQHGVDANFIAAQIQQESGGNPKAVNNADVAVTGSPSLGIAQFQPATAAQYGVTDPTDPKQAIPGMAAYMSDLLKQYGGDYKKAAAAYNWGPGNLTQAIATYGDKWQDHIPNSTQNYINAIFSVAVPTSNIQSVADMVVQPPTEASRAPTNPDWFNRLDWKQQFEIIHDAEQGVRANQVRDAQTIQLAEQQRKTQQQKSMNTMFDRIGSTDNPLTVAEIRTSDLDYQNKEHMLTAINAVNRGEMATDPAVFNDLFHRIHLPDGDPDKITDDDVLSSYVGKGLALEQRNQLVAEITGKKTAQGKMTDELQRSFFTNARKQIDGSISSMIDSSGSDKYYKFNQFALGYINDELKRGTPPADIFNPDSKKYVGQYIPLFRDAREPNKNTYGPFISTTEQAQRMQKENGRLATVAIPKIRPGETPAEFLRRVRK